MGDDFESIVRQKALELYQACDVEDKGYITKTDMQRLVEHLSLDIDQLEDVFDSLDNDGNEQLTLEEFTDGFGQFIGGSMTGGDSDVMSQSVYEEGVETDEDQFNVTMKELGAAGIFEESISVENVKELWSQVRRTKPDLLPHLELLLTRVSGEIQQSHSDYKSLESAMKTKITQHDEEVRHLYDEMENQIKTEREKLMAEERLKERQWREEMVRELQEKDKQVQEIQKKHDETSERLEELNKIHAQTSEEYAQMSIEKQELEDQLEETQCNLEESQMYIEEVRNKFKCDRRARAKNAIAMSEGIAIERENLVRQLESVRYEFNKLKDARDESQAKEGTDCGLGGGEIIHFMEGQPDQPQEAQTQRRGSMLGAYFGMGGVMGHDLTEEDEEDIEVDDDPVPPEVAPVPIIIPETVSSCLTETPSIPKYEPPPMTEATVQTDREQTPPPCPIKDERPAPDGANEEEQHYEPIFNGSKSPERIFKIVFVGDSGVGKSSIIYRFCHDSFKSTFSATIGVDFQIKSVQLKDYLAALQIWDTAGQERFRSITKQYYRKSDGVIIVYDITNPSSYLNVRQWISDVDDGTDENAVIMLLGNKSDVPKEPDQDSGHCVKTKQGQQLAEQYGALFYEVSAKDGENVTEAFHELASCLKQKEDDDLRAAIQVSADIEKKKGCCVKK